MVTRLEQSGESVVAVTSGDEYRWTDKNHITIDGRSANDYVRLIEEIAEQFGEPQRILHLWNVADFSPQVSDRMILKPFEAHDDRFTTSQEHGCYSLLYLARALTHMQGNRVSVILVGNGLCDVSGVEDLCPNKATILGLCNVLAQENTNILCRCIDILASAETLQTDSLISWLLAEAVWESADPLIAYRGKHRLKQEYQLVRLEGQIEPIRTLRDEGVYLVTGGLGKIGISLAKHLARSKRARLFLLDRISFPPRESWQGWIASREDQDAVSAKIRTLLEMEGSEVTCPSSLRMSQTYCR